MNISKRQYRRTMEVLMEVKFVIFARKVDGEVFECFRWCRDAQSGVDRAFADAKRFGVEITEAWAVEV